MRSLDSAATSRVISRVPSFEPDDAHRQARHQVLERALARVDREERHEPVDRRQQHQPLRAQGDALGVQAQPGGVQPRLVKSDAFEQAGRASISDRHGRIPAGTFGQTLRKRCMVTHPGTP